MIKEKDNGRLKDTNSGELEAGGGGVSGKISTKGEKSTGTLISGGISSGCILIAGILSGVGFWNISLLIFIIFLFMFSGLYGWGQQLLDNFLNSRNSNLITLTN